MYGQSYDYDRAIEYFQSTVPRKQIKQKGTVTLTLKLWAAEVFGFGASQSGVAKIDESYMDAGSVTAGAVYFKNAEGESWFKISGNDGFGPIKEKVTAQMPEG